MDSSTGCVVLVTGGSGFLGQHIVGLLQDRADHVTEIRVLDVIPYENKLDYVERKPVKQYVGSVTDKDLVMRACKGVDCVMHVASIVDTSLIPDEEKSYRINVKGTENVIAACLKNGVKRLIYCSSAEVVTGSRNIYDGTEENTDIETDQLFKPYGPTKIEAERLVLEANSSRLKTLSLRPVVMYGELEWRSLGLTVTGFLAKTFGSYVQINCGKGLSEHVYVGNVAWGFVCAEINLYQDKVDKESIGRAYFLADGSPRTSVCSFMEDVMNEIGLKPIAMPLPVWFFVNSLYILYLILSVISIVYRVNFFVGIPPFQCLERIFLFRYKSATEKLGYIPIYSYVEAKTRTVNYFNPYVTSKG
ncbi:3 beta-hydroxysteroid dehydrogenase/Delta 5--_4-isomerase type 1-like isoform X1 [Ruditapes philippinarum]|uniref:3 beta-hydroxysteroid dehydrogenase/Delta 5-->4-isomerase type 1-like isoform X1 n=1 Tax=Ruditapes philippinarum TaxID=129788 RepID=UPI00295B3619|nr:3 beta-hydroxysteroid dehydrogenase/Delta 5-->4-isomerase type 1-like isoform X1 [Ruditapes philippinarum]